LNVLSVISFDWNLFWLAFLVILIGSFVPEWTWKKYSDSLGSDGSQNFAVSDNGQADDEADLALIFLCPRAFDGTHPPSLVRL